MLTNEDLKQEFDLFSDIWKLFKYLQPVQSNSDEAYWDEVTKQIKGIMQKYPGELGKDLALAVLGELERKSKETTP